MRFLCVLTGLAAALVSPLAAGEIAVLKNGFSIRAERHEVVDGLARLHTSTGSLEVPLSEISVFEQEENVPPPAAKAVEAPAAAVPETVPADPGTLLEIAARTHGLRPEFVRSVARAESGLNPKAISPKGAIGLMQLMPGTASGLGADPRDMAQNAEAGARYLKQLLERYKSNPDFVRLALAAYNAGPGAVDRYRAIPPYRETQDYVERVLRAYQKQLAASAKP